MTSKDYIYRNAIIDEGPPVRYRLRLNVVNLDGEGEASLLRRCTLGEKDPSKPNKTVLLVGGTGSGKSTFINSLFNYVMGVKKENNEWFEIVEDSKANSNSESSTLKVTVYEIFGFEGKTLPYSVTIIDTPGFGHTRQLERDAVISQKLCNLFSLDVVEEIHAVGLVLKASENRLSDRLLYIFNSVTSLFGKDLEEKIVALITHSDGMPPTNALKALQDAKIKCARTEREQPVHFVFNNCLNIERTEDTEFGLEQAWRVTMRGMERFAAFVDESEPQKLEEAVVVLNERIRLTACINNLKDRIQLLKLRQEEIQQTQEGLEKHEEKLRTGESFRVEVDEPYIEKEVIEGGMWLFMFGGAVCCTVCKENCHYPGCTLAWYPSHCKVMKNGRCTVCTNKCPASAHVKERKKYVIKTRKIEKTIEELKERFEADRDQSQSLLSKLQNEEKSLQKEKVDFLNAAFQHIVSLEEIALNVNSVSTFVHLDFLIEMMKENGDMEKVQKLEEMKMRMDKGLMQCLRYRFGYLGSKMMEGIKSFAK